MASLTGKAEEYSMVAEPARRAARLQRLNEILYRSPRGYSTSELARMLGVGQRTIQRDLAVLESELGVPVLAQGGRYSVDRSARLAPLGLSVDEARALYLALRLYTRYTDEQDPDVLTSLSKLGEILPAPMARRVAEAVTTLADRAANPAFSETMRVLTQGWARARRVSFSYRSARGNESQVDLEPYFIEPGTGFSTYVIGFSHTHKSIRVFKIERAHEARLLAYSFEMPDDFSIESVLGPAWGVWIGGEKKDVILRFSRAVAERLLEAQWHPSQVIERQPDGSYLVRLTVSDTVEVASWIRSWGPEVEVLMPAELRDQFAADAGRALSMYS
ncbi:MAG: WYL domain-containing protein [Dehalococcoidia bacterium]|nr:WYL domain-containing protein [Dehalococcoidia bacterium]